jgi:cell division protein FtsQ
MEKQRKISVRKVMRLLVTVVSTTACVIAVLGSAQIQEMKPLRDVKLHIRNSQYRFIDSNELWRDLIMKANIVEGQTRLSILNVRAVEQNAMDNPWVAQAEAYLDNKRDLHVFVTQRIPVARLFFENSSSSYVDTNGNLLPLSDQYTFYTPVVTNVPVWANDSVNKAIRKQVVKLVRFIERDSFWSAQIAQISVTPELKFEMTPVLGTHKVLFGDISSMEQKFEHLFAFYKTVLNKIGWDTYQSIDLRFDDQIIASPAVPWNPSVQNPISNMDWVKSIIASAPKETTETIAAKERTLKAMKEKQSATTDRRTAALQPVVPQNTKQRN